MHHRLVLPLPAAFASSQRVGGSDEYSVFDHQHEVHASITAYMTDLIQFLSRHRVVQYHPESYFSYKPSAERSATDEVPLHYDGTAISDEELHEFHRLLSAFAAFLPEDPNESVKALAEIVRDGPAIITNERVLLKPHLTEDASRLHEFYDTTKRLMICRQRRPQCDYASLTFQTKAEGEEVTLQSRCCPDHKDKESEAIMSIMVDHNMCKKKQHEVSVMRGCLRDLLQNCCPDDASSCDFRSRDGIQGSTLMNIGEGKGYCSRVLALCDGVQVVGLDCNPDHKEGSSGRVEKVVEGQVGSSGVNLLYRPRGHMASITCRVGPNMNWEETLKGHVSTKREDGTVTPLSTALLHEDTSGKQLALAQLEKVQCLVCGHIVRRQAQALVLKHIREHMGKDMTAGDINKPLTSCFDGSALTLQPAQYKQYLETVPQAEFVALVLDSCFTDSITIMSSNSNLKGKPGLDKRPRDEATTASSSTVVLPRATRAEVWIAVQLHEEIRQPASIAAEVDDAAKKAVPPTTKRICVCPGIATVLGFDEGTGRHKLLLDPLDVALSRTLPTTDDTPPSSAVVLNLKNLASQNMCILQELPWEEAEDAHQHAETFLLNAVAAASAPRESAPSGQKHLLSPPPSTGVFPLVVLRRVVPMLAPLAPPISVPSLSNVVMMGLHTCGNLGSSICRLFTESQSPGLLLVSCCWHALTNEGFPLSNIVKSAGVTTQSISLMLATQPLDMWGAESSEGHRGSTKLMFFRSILTPLWRSIQREHATWKKEIQTSFPSECSCTFPPQPHLEPAFLRRMAKVKHTVTLFEFALEVLREYVVNPSGWTLRQQEEHGSRMCEGCSLWSKRLCSTEGGEPSGGNAWLHTVADTIEVEYMKQDFKKFIGLSVLRMWMSHLVETLLLLDRALYLHETLKQSGIAGSDVTLAPLFDGTLSPRMFGIFARRH
ncbi:methyltransferase, putative [Bodo saltans]|uniref:Methyltransferase, putative n=1 Tax=Bodo saltans TaxID=75058 RepID=A0A0S4J6V1_BODSA|nr:methyltransferase, putative [Bodo saltans]|eukprot:CUG87203.1 methyltransferase, putative [Bodo saltans]